MIDTHAHLFHPAWYPRPFLEALVRDFAARRKSSGSSNESAALERTLLRMLTDATGEMTLRIMDRIGIEKRVVLVVDWGVEIGEAEKSLWQIHKEIFGICNRYPDRFVGFAGVDPRRRDATKLITWAFDGLGARGLKLHPTGGWRLTDSATVDVVGLAAERNLPVLVHLGRTVDVLSDANAQPQPFMDLARLFPSIPLIAGHSGFELCRSFVDSDSVPSNILFDISGWQTRMQAEGQAAFLDLEAMFGAFPGRVCFATDSPFFSYNLVASEQRWIDQLMPTYAGKWADVPLALPSLFS
ncbi:MAG: amidohydrolase family protein [Verrucomicrobia bacterium]|nr:amidohydrolase family protein [Verrucomicrobiota bacterium]